MHKCPICNFINLDERETCLKCKAVLSHRPAIAAKISRPPRRNLLAPLQRRVTRLWRRVARALEVPLPENLPHRFPFLAAFLGLAPGVGQLYNRQPKKLFYFIPPFVAAFALTIRYITTPYVGNIFIACTICVMMGSFTDALLTAARINGQYFTLRNTLAALTYPFCLLGLIGMFCALMAFLHWDFFTLFYVGHDYMRPALNRKDRICCEGLTYWIRKPRPGDVVRYDPPVFTAEMPGGLESGVWYSNPQNGWERVMAVGGETLERRDGEYYVDGKRLSPEYYPLLNTEMFLNFKIVCPPGKYIVLMSSRPDDAGFINRMRAGRGGTGPDGVSSIFQVPRFDTPGLVLIGWEDACIIEKKDIYSRAWFIYHPSARRRIFQARGPRFVQE